MNDMTDPQLVEFSATIWRPGTAQFDPSHVSATIGADGQIEMASVGRAEPESELERLFTMIWHSAKPLRQSIAEDDGRTPVVTRDGTILDAETFDFQFVARTEHADGFTTFHVPWEIC